MIRRGPPEPPLEILERMRQPALADSRPGGDERRRSAVGGISGAIRAEGKRRRRRYAWPLAAAAGVLLVGGAVGVAARTHGARSATAHLSKLVAAEAAAGPVELTVSSGVAVVTKHGVPSAVPASSTLRIAEGDGVRTGPDARAVLVLPRGVRVDLSRATKASVASAEEDDQKLALDIGETSISVPKPGGPHTFSVTTPDARVVVHGTEFKVVVQEADASHTTRTSVFVTRGSVSVIDAAGERLLSPGESWSAGDVSAPGRAAAAPTTESRTHVPAGRDASSLAEQNKLFQAALDARRAGDDAAVLRAIDELFARYPDTTLAEEARLAKFRALKALHRNQEAAREAKRYLSAHPDAPAADEARRALLESTTGSEP